MPQQKRNSSRGLIFLGIGFLVIGCFLVGVVLGIGVYGFIQNTGKDTLTIESKDQETLDKISERIAYNTGFAGEVDYYSPNLNLKLKYDNTDFDLSEAGTSKALYFYATDLSLSDFTMTMRKTPKSSQTFKDFYINEYKNTYPTIELVSESENVLNYKYSYKSGLEDKTVESKVSVVFREVSDQIIYVEIKSYKGKEVSTSLIEKIRKIVNSVDFNTEDVVKTIEKTVGDSGVVVSIDRDKWLTSYESPYNLSLSFNTESLDTDELKYELVDFDINVRDGFYLDLNEEFLQKEMQASIDLSKEIKGDNGFEIIDQGEKTIAGQKFLFFKNKVKYGLDEYIEEEYFGINPVADYMVTIETYYPSGSEVSVKELNALIDSIKFEESGTTSEGVLGTGTIEIPKPAILGQAAVVHIFNRTCVDLAVGNVANLPSVANKNFNMCSAGFGSGFFIDKKGVIATNAHVATPNPESVLQIVLAGKGYDKDNYYGNLVVDIINAYEAKNPGYFLDIRDPQTLEALIGLAIKITSDMYADGLIKAENPQYSNYIQQDEPFELDRKTLDITDKKKVLSTQVVTYNKIEDLSSVNEVTVADVAIIKVAEAVDVSEFPTLDIANFNSVVSGQQIFVIGFPGAAELKGLFSDASTTIPTVTNGTVSAIKPSVNNTFKLIQMDAVISGGNSGGPVINIDGDVVGLSTYELNPSSGDEYYAAVSSEEITELLLKEGIILEKSVYGDHIENAIDYIANDYYKWAIDELTKAEDLYPSSERNIQPFIQLAQGKIDEGEDNTPIFQLDVPGVEKVYVHKGQVPYILGGFVVFGLGVLLIMFAILKKLFGGKKDDKSAGDTVKSDPSGEAVFDPGAVTLVAESSTPSEVTEVVIPPQISEPMTPLSTPPAPVDSAVEPIVPDTTPLTLPRETSSVEQSTNNLDPITPISEVSEAPVVEKPLDVLEPMASPSVAEPIEEPIASSVPVEQAAVPVVVPSMEQAAAPVEVPQPTEDTAVVSDTLNPTGNEITPEIKTEEIVVESPVLNENVPVESTDTLSSITGISSASETGSVASTIELTPESTISEPSTTPLEGPASISSVVSEVTNNGSSMSPSSVTGIEPEKVISPEPTLTIDTPEIEVTPEVAVSQSPTEPVSSNLMDSIVPSPSENGVGSDSTPSGINSSLSTPQDATGDPNSVA